MASSVEVGSSSVDSMVDGKGGLVVHLQFGTATLHDAAIRTNEQQVRDGHCTKQFSERRHPERIFLDGIPERQMTSNAFVVTKHTEYSISLGKPLLASLSLLLERVVRGGLGEFELGRVLLDLLGTRLGGRGVIGGSRRGHDKLAG